VSVQASNHSLLSMSEAPPPNLAPRNRAAWAVVITSLALFMATLDNLVVTTALPVIRARLHAGLAGLEWTVNAYTLTFAVLLLTGAALGDRFGRRRMFLTGLVIFTGASAAAALSPTVGWLVTARAVQGAGGALIMPLSLTLLSAAVAPERRNQALGVWGAIGGVAVAAGPLVGGAVTSGWSWESIFWINVPVGIVLLALARWRLAESTGPRQPLDIGGVVLATAGLLGTVLGLVRANAHGWTSAGVLGSFAVGAIGLGGFVAWELCSTHPMLPLRLFRSRSVAVPSGRPALLPARRRAPGPALDRHAHAGGAPGGRPGAAFRRTAGARRGAGAPGRRSGVARPRVDSDAQLLAPVAPVRGVGGGHGLVLRPLGLGRVVVGAP
jgi:MFS family permease